MSVRVWGKENCECGGAGRGRGVSVRVRVWGEEL